MKKNHAMQVLEDVESGKTKTFVPKNFPSPPEHPIRQAQIPEPIYTTGVGRHGEKALSPAEVAQQEKAKVWAAIDELRGRVDLIEIELQIARPKASP